MSKNVKITSNKKCIRNPTKGKEKEDPDDILLSNLMRAQSVFKEEQTQIKKKTMEDVDLEEADNIWKYIKNYKKEKRKEAGITTIPAVNNYMDLETFHVECCVKFKRFTDKYPIVIRYMCFTDEYRKEALKKYMRYAKNNIPKSKEELYCDFGAIYVKFLYSEINPKCTQDQAHNVRHNAYIELREEFVRIQAAEEEAEKISVNNGIKKIKNIFNDIQQD